MRIGIFTDDFLPRNSGVVTSILQLRRGLIEFGHEVYIIAPDHPNYTDELSGIIRLPSFDPLLFQNLRAAIPSSKYNRVIQDLKLDIVHSMTQNNVGIYADYIAKKNNCPHITTTHTINAELMRYYPGQMISGYLIFAQLYKHYFGQRIKLSLPNVADMTSNHQPKLAVLKQQIWNLQNVFLNNVDHVIVPSQHMLKLLNKHGLETSTTVVPNGIDINFFANTKKRQYLKNDQLHVVTVGRLGREKRQDVLIKAVAEAPGATLSIIGDGPYLTKYQRLAASLGMNQSKIIFYGAQNQAFIKQKLHEADVFALASYKFDTQGIVLLEAAAAGLPIVYCDKKLIESMSPQASVLAERNHIGFATQFKALQNRDKLSAMSKNAKEFAKQYNYTFFVKKIEQVYIAQRANYIN